ncbi:MAG: trans-aconitate 2-methyltransferase [Jatrophihabitans sp.]|uniref:trans-aconitate 2-methyltransferase n=1 Tax=Jatrophihabitans sp. TaxID=1932789 RepID=UPI003F7FCE89
MRWDPEQYGRYGDERSRPFVELVSRVVAEAPHRVVDVGCGSGALTALLAERWPDAVVEGFDSSPEMIAAADEHASGRVRFAIGDAASWTPPPDVDVIVSNAVLQWVPDHRVVLGRWAEALAPGGWLAVQVPGNFGAPSHRLMRELAAEPPWAERLDGVLRHDDAVAEPVDYAAELLASGLVVDAWETTYVHVLSGSDPVLEWVRGTGLRPVLAALGDDAPAFEREYAARLRTAYPPTPAGTLFPFRRILVVAHRPAG